MAGNVYHEVEKECMKNSDGEPPLEESNLKPVKEAVLVTFLCLLSLFAWIRSIRPKSKHARKFIHPKRFEPED
jgi:hypothetical protein